tara:strand:+ start:3142 stop:3474 length:333 start_codon:yes stop_codon:yes gene_type:complete
MQHHYTMQYHYDDSTEPLYTDHARVYYRNGIRHHDTYPALIEYWPDGSLKRAAYYQRGQIGPSEIRWGDNHIDAICHTPGGFGRMMTLPRPTEPDGIREKYVLSYPGARP